MPALHVESSNLNVVLVNSAGSSEQCNRMDTTATVVVPNSSNQNHHKPDNNQRTSCVNSKSAVALTASGRPKEKRR